MKVLYAARLVILRLCTMCIALLVSAAKSPAVIGIFGQAPIELKLVDPSKPPVREV
jgi:hypothetical protein